MARSGASAHCGTNMTIADYPMQLMVCDVEEALGFAVAVVGQARCAEAWILKCNRECRFSARMAA